ncbi:Fc.00g102480.m01.CDS01 [Cosmosporella sp. VM-42]
MPSNHVSSPLAIPSPQRSMRLVTSQDLYTSINATLASKDNRPSTPNHHIQEDDYTVPAPPPPSPVSFRPEHWPTSIRR